MGYKLMLLINGSKKIRGFTGDEGFLAKVTADISLIKYNTTKICGLLTFLSCFALFLGLQAIKN